ncbi:MAG TPA: penicillin-binding protein 2 [Micromonospora sp.]
MPSRATDPRRYGDGGRPEVPRASRRTTDAGSLGGILGAKAYTPRGRTLRESAEQRREPDADAAVEARRRMFRVVDGGQARSEARHAAERGEPERLRDREVVPRPRSRRGTTNVLSRRSPSGATVRRVRDSRPASRRLSSRRPPRLADPRRRLRLATAMVLAMFATIGIRLVVLQIVDTPAYADGGLAARLSAPIVIPAPRGSIYDRNGAVLAHSVEARYVYADPQRVEDPNRAAELLSPLLNMPVDELKRRMTPHKRADGRWSEFEFLARGVDVDVANQILDLGLPGIGVDRDERRDVPGRDLAANVLGFAGQDMVGLEGLEASYDDVLRGENGERVFEIGQGKLAAPIPGGYSREKAAKPGSSLVLTIDRDLQYEVQRILTEAMTKHQGGKAAAVVLDVRTGEVLAQASYPTYDVSNWQQSNPEDREDVATSFVVDPGSVHKALVLAAALEEGVITPDSTVTVGPAIRKGDVVFRDTHPMPEGTRMTLPGIMAYSSNVGIIKIADKLGAQRLYEYQLRFGLGRKTGVGLPGEASGKVLSPKEWSGSSYGSIPIGHSVDVTPLQMAAAYAAIANDGVWIQPRLVRETIAPDGTRTPAPDPETRRVVSPETAAAVRTAMEAVTTVKDATGVRAAIAGYRVAGKTGTGKRVVNGRYASGTVASFIGMAPAENPRFVIAVFADTPNGSGGDVSAPAFRDMMSFTLRHYRVPPSTSQPPTFEIQR